MSDSRILQSMLEGQPSEVFYKQIMERVEKDRASLSKNMNEEERKEMLAFLVQMRELLALAMKSGFKSREIKTLNDKLNTMENQSTSNLFFEINQQLADKYNHGRLMRATHVQQLFDKMFLRINKFHADMAWKIQERQARNEALQRHILSSPPDEPLPRQPSLDQQLVPNQSDQTIIRRLGRESLPKHVPVQAQSEGSVLFFSPNLGTGEKGTTAGPTEDQKFISKLMRLIAGVHHGRNWLTHVAVVCAKDKEGAPLIGHATEKGDEESMKAYEDKSRELREYHGPAPYYKLGYEKEHLQEQVDRDQDRAYISFSPNGQSIYEKILNYFGKEFCDYNKLTPDTVEKEMAKHIAAAGDIDNHPGLRDIKWTYAAGAAAMIKGVLGLADWARSGKVNLGKLDRQANSTICSEFGARAIQIGALNYFRQLYANAQQQYEDKKIQHAGKVKKGVRFESVMVRASEIPGYVNIQPNTTPKELFDKLYTSQDFKMSCYLGNKPLERVRDCLLRIIVDNPDKATEAKDRARNTAKAAVLDAYQKASDRQAKGENETQLVADILYRVLPEFRNISKAAFKDAVRVGEGMGIDYSHDVKRFGRSR